MSSLERSIVNTVSYFDIFDYPLTEWEIYNWLYSEEKKAYSFSEIRQAMHTSDVLAKKICYKNGMVMLAGRGELLKTRQERYITSYHKYSIAKRFAGIVRHLPFIQLLASCNNLAFFNAKKQSDLDFFIVTNRVTMPIVRILMVAVSLIFFKRPDEKHHKDTICLSFFVDTEHLSLSKLALEKNDIYFSYWYLTLQPLVIRSKKIYYSLQEENKLLLEMLPRHLSRISTQLTYIGTTPIQSFLETLVSVFNLEKLSNMFYHLQLRRLPQAITTTMNIDSSVIVTPSIFKTHIYDKRVKIYERWKQNKSR